MSGGTGACDLAISNITVEVVGDPVSLTGSSCEITFNISFDLKYNSGNKQIYFHSFLESNYVSSFSCSPNGGGGAKNPPTSTTLGTGRNAPGFSFLDIGIDNTISRGAIGQEIPLTVLTTYYPDASVELTTPANSPGLTVTKTATSTSGVDRVKITNVKVVVNQSCATALVVRTDVWATQTPGQGQAQCYVCGQPATFNNPAITGVINCTNPRTFTFGVTTTSASDQYITIKAYIDANDNGSIDSTGPNPDYLIYNSNTDPSVTQPLFINTNKSFGKNAVEYPPYNSQAGLADKNILLVLTSPQLPNARLQLIKKNPLIQCASLPVKLKSFDVKRTSKDKVSLTWITSTETNNSGFDVQRKIGGGEWQTVAFVMSQANGGNSESELTYQFNDNNSAKGVSQYRLRQVDIDRRATISDVRSVRGEEMAGGSVLVFPNPSQDGKVNLLFEDKNTTRNITVSDMTGRIIKQYRNNTGNSLMIDGLETGMYHIHITDMATSETKVEKVIIKKR